MIKNLIAAWIALLALVPRWALGAVPPEWKATQEVRTAGPGLHRLRLPIETLSQAQSTLSDIRLFDANGQEIPYFFDQPQAVPAQEMELQGMTLQMQGKRTFVTGAVPQIAGRTAFDAVYLYTPTADFLKPLTIEGSRDRVHWTVLANHAPIFPATTALAGPPILSGGKQPEQSLSSTVRFPQGDWAWLRLILDDADSDPIRISSVRVGIPGTPVSDLQDYVPQIVEQASDAHQTKIHLLLPNENFPVETIRIEAPERTFRRTVRFGFRRFSAGEFREEPLGQGFVYRVTLSEKTAEELTVPVRRVVPGRELVLTIENSDSQPLAISKITVRALPRDLVFDAPGGPLTLAAGNPQAPFRQYDVAALRGMIGQSPVQAATAGPLIMAAGKQAPAPAIALAVTGSEIDTDPWRYRKAVSFPATANASGLWRLELDPEAIAHNENRTAALRLVQGSRQWPYILDHAGAERSINPALEMVPSGNSRISIWKLTFPVAGIPITQLRLSVPEALFQRNVSVFEEADGSVGDGQGPVIAGKKMTLIGSSQWVRTVEGSPETFTLALYRQPQREAIYLQTDNGDNPPIHPAEPKAFYRGTRLLFQAPQGSDPVYLYYGQSDVSAPTYDLALIAEQLRSIPPGEAQLGPEEVLRTRPWWQAAMPGGTPRTLFWIVMGVVVAVLLFVIARLLPAQES